MKPVSRDALGDLVYDQMVRMLLNNDLKPGERILKKELARIIGVSQTPVNEAVTRLVREGIIVQRERSGFYVRVFTDQDMMEIFAVRAGLEGTALRQCMEKELPPAFERILASFDDYTLPVPETRHAEYRKRDQEFHSAILRLSGNRMILDFIRNFEFILRCYQKGLIRDPNETLKEHKQIVAAIRAGDGEQAQLLLMRHHWNTRERLREKIDAGEN